MKSRPVYPFTAPGNVQQSSPSQYHYQPRRNHNPFAPPINPRNPLRQLLQQSPSQVTVTVPPISRNNPFLQPPRTASRPPTTRPVTFPAPTNDRRSSHPPYRNMALIPPDSSRSSSTLVDSNEKMVYMAPDIWQIISEKYHLGADPSLWGSHVTPDFPEPDDALHNPDPRRDHRKDHGGTIFTARGLTNVGCMALLIIALLAFFIGYPLIHFYLEKASSTNGGYNLGGINGTGQIPSLTGNWGLIDADTPKEAYTRKTYTDGEEEWTLVFSDEFNVEGRSFYPGDDPYWEAAELWYWQTKDLEKYDPNRVTTKNGSLVLTIDKTNLTGTKWPDLNYTSGMLTSWNKFCFTGGMMEVSASLPGSNDVWGFWPAIWAMGNLGRAGYGATTDGLWPYSYDSCDAGALANQTYPDGTPTVTAHGGEKGKPLSYLPGQRLSACTCSGEDHPGPKRSDGSFVGRSAPEIDALEAGVRRGKPTRGSNSQSGQWAPFNLGYHWKNTSDNMIFHDKEFTLNSYEGGPYQQATSGHGPTNQDCYELEQGCHAIYGFEYKPGNDGFITFINNGRASWTIKAPGLGPEEITQIGQRLVPVEPMYVVLNLALSWSFNAIDFARLKFPAHFLIDYVRIYQPKDKINIGCSPKDFPTEKYIEKHIEAYTNPDLITWRKDYGGTWPKNRLVDDC